MSARQLAPVSEVIFGLFASPASNSFPQQLCEAFAIKLPLFIPKSAESLTGLVDLGLEQSPLCVCVLSRVASEISSLADAPEVANVLMIRQFPLSSVRHCCTGAMT